jgi:hypothetical protein
MGFGGGLGGGMGSTLSIHGLVPCLDSILAKRTSPYLGSQHSEYSSFMRLSPMKHFKVG